MLIRNHTATVRKLYLSEETRTEDPKSKDYVPEDQRAYLERRRWTFAEKRAFMDSLAREVLAKSDYSRAIEVLSQEHTLGVGNLDVQDDDGNVTPFEVKRKADGSIDPECWDALPLSVLVGFFNEVLRLNSATVERAKKSEPRPTTPPVRSPNAAEPVETEAATSTDAPGAA